MKSISLQHNNIEDEGAKLIINTLENNHNIFYINLSCNHTCTETVKAIAFILSINKKLICANIMSHTDEEDLNLIIPSLEKNYTL